MLRRMMCYAGHATSPQGQGGTSPTPPEINGFKFYKFRFTSNCGDSLLQIGSVQLFEGGVELQPKRAMNPGGRSPDNEEPQKVLSRASRGKWLDFHFARNGYSELVLELKGTASVDTYELWTANDCPGRDPTQWTLLGASSSCGPWTQLDTQIANVPSGRFAPYGRFVVGAKGSAGERVKENAVQAMLALGIEQDMVEFALEHENLNVDNAILFATSAEGLSAFQAAFLSPPVLVRTTTDKLTKRWQRPHAPLPEYASAAAAICVVPSLMGQSVGDGALDMLEAAIRENPLQGDFEDVAFDVVQRAYGLSSKDLARRQVASFPGVASGNFFQGLCSTHAALGWRGRYFFAAWREIVKTQDAGTLQMCLALSTRAAEECQARKVASFQSMLRFLESGEDKKAPDSLFESAKYRLVRQASEFIDGVKEKAFVSTFEEPTKMYFRYTGDSTMEGDVEVHGSNVYLSILLATLGIKLPREPHMSDEAKAICMFLDANMGPVQQELWLPENLGKPFISMKSERPRPRNVPRNVFIFDGSTPKEIANAAVDDSPALASRRSKLRPYLEQFSSYFRAECLLEPIIVNMIQTVEQDLKTFYAGMQTQHDGLPADYREYIYDVDNGYKFSQANALVLLREIGVVKQADHDEQIDGLEQEIHKRCKVSQK